MKMHHSPGHWIAVALVLAFTLLTLSNLYGQRTDAAATFQGRPAMAGAQGGVGAGAGPPQGGLGPQGSEAAEKVIRQSPQSTTKTVVDVEPPPNFAGPRDDVRKPEDAAKDKSVTPKKKESGVAKDETSATKKGKRAAKGTADRSRYGVSPIDSASPTSAPPTGN